jgi:single-strand DNA-binding protein
MIGHARAQIVGNLTRDPELRYTSNGTTVCNFGVAVNRRRGEEESVSFLECVGWAKQAEAMTEHLHKGGGVFLEADIRQESWEKDGQKRSMLKLHVWSWIALDRKPQEPEAPNTDEKPLTTDDIPF